VALSAFPVVGSLCVFWNFLCLCLEPTW
jgi:hypothetical protein